MKVVEIEVGKKKFLMSYQREDGVVSLLATGANTERAKQRGIRPKELIVVGYHGRGGQVVRAKSG